MQVCKTNFWTLKCPLQSLLQAKKMKIQHPSQPQEGSVLKKSAVQEGNPSYLKFIMMEPQKIYQAIKNR